MNFNLLPKSLFSINVIPLAEIKCIFINLYRSGFLKATASMKDDKFIPIRDLKANKLIMFYMLYYPGVRNDK